MRIFAIGDLHLGHGLQKPMDLFGEHWRNHTDKIKDSWMRSVQEEDVVLLLGDLSWAMRLEEAKDDFKWLMCLPGKKICIRGNHDYWWDRLSKLQRTYPKITFLQNNCYHIDGITLCGTRGWNVPSSFNENSQDVKLYLREIQRLQLSLECAVKEGASEIWVMLHFPPTLSGEINSPITELIAKYPVTRVIYGHLHDPLSWETCIQGNYSGILYELVSADYLQFKPRLLKD